MQDVIRYKKINLDVFPEMTFLDIPEMIKKEIYNLILC